MRGGDSEFRTTGSHAAASRRSAQQLFVALRRSAPSLVATAIRRLSPEGGSATRLAISALDPGAGARKLARSRRVRRLLVADGTYFSHLSSRRFSFVAILDVAEPRLRYLDPGLGFAVEPVFSPDGAQVAFVHYVDPPAGAAANSGPYWSIRVADSKTGIARLLWTAPAGPGGRFEGTRGQDLFWSLDGKLVFPWERSGWLHPYAIDAVRGGAPSDLTPGAFEVETYLLGADGRSLLYAANVGDLNRRHSGVAPSPAAPVSVTAGGGIESSPTLAGNALAVIAPTSPARPSGPRRPGAAAAQARRCRAEFVAPEPVLFRAADGVEVHAMLFRAAGPGRHPALVYVHGGPRRQMMPGFHPSGYYSNAYIFNQHLASRGYTVLAVNYRSGTGYGAEFRDAPEQARGGASEYRDVLAAGRWLAARTEVDPARIGIWGGSWGGYLVALGLARNSELFAAGVDFHGVHSMLRPLPGNLSPDAQNAARQLQWDSSPLGAIDAGVRRCCSSTATTTATSTFRSRCSSPASLRTRRIPYRELVFPNERHSFLVHAHWLRASGPPRPFWMSL